MANAVERVLTERVQKLKQEVEHYTNRVTDLTRELETDAKKGLARAKVELEELEAELGLRKVI